ncbi:sporulation related domain protein [Geobacter sp. OR-1]|uniref:SPOR domain-containing protein n=1 Tax=Geobacter sp. OR-1 TaxID=1266765 RepID=UPI00054266D9|nr:SPOR domain-containing protein [Geobacter sp. OR-1]GAM11603.1 sporulation related domain protein [Geobacter sp. OR-1]
MRKVNGERKGESGASQSLLLGILAVLVALFGYLYFFTGLIKEREVQQKPAPSPVQKVKQPIPPRPAGGEAKVSPPPASTPSAQNKPLPAAVPVAPAKAAPVTPVAAPKPPAPQAKPVPEQPKTPPQLQPPAKAATKPEKPANAQPVKSQGKAPLPDKAAKAPASAKPVAERTVSESSYRITTSGIFSADKANAALSELKKSGVERVEKKQVKEEKAMKRLFAGEYDDSQSAYAELEKIKKYADGAFLVPASGKYELYAGSYDQENRAEREIKRLAGKGVNVTLKKAKLMLPVIRISGTATDKKQADSIVKRLRKLGIAAEAKKVTR